MRIIWPSTGVQTAPCCRAESCPATHMAPIGHRMHPTLGSEELVTYSVGSQSSQVQSVWAAVPDGPASAGALAGACTTMLRPTAHGRHCTWIVCVSEGSAGIPAPVSVSLTCTALAASSHTRSVVSKSAVEM